MYQTLVGAWPLPYGRLAAYLEKALREAKRNTNWLEPNATWEEEVKRFCEALYANAAFQEDFEPFAAEVAALGGCAALSQLVLRFTSPGVPDIYDGDEVTYLALVDPDNRRPIDWRRRADLLAGLRTEAGPTIETVKLFVIHQALALRARRPDGAPADTTSRSAQAPAPVPIAADGRSPSRSLCAVTRPTSAAARDMADLLPGIDACLGGDPRASSSARLHRQRVYRRRAGVLS